ncbi:MAG TPA: hypothetical protein VF727_15410 [Allosphingosinicella sp.]
MGVLSVALVGETLDNEDGSSRQEEVALCHVGESVHFVLEPDERVDALVTVLSARRVRIGGVGPGNGWLPRMLEQGVPVSGFIESIGRTMDGRLGIVLEVSTGPDAAHHIAG